MNESKHKLTLRMNNLGDLISDVKTKSGAPVTKCTSCPASIKCLATYTFIPIQNFNNIKS